MKEQIKDLSMGKIHSSPLNPRKIFDKDKMDELADSIKNEGLKQPITVRPFAKKVGEFEVIFGERRFRAHKMNKAKTIKAIIKDVTDDEARISMLLENLHREDLSQLDEGEHFKELHEIHKIPLREIARRISKAEGYVRHRYNLVKKLSTAVKELMEPKKDASQERSLDYAIARELTDLSKPDQKKLAKKAVEYHMTRDQVVKVKKQASELEATLDRVQDPKFKKELETEYLPKKFDTTALPRMQVEILKKQKLWVEKPKFEAELVPLIKKLESFTIEYDKRSQIVEGKGIPADIAKIKAKIEKFLQDNPDLHYWIFLVKL